MAEHKIVVEFKGNGQSALPGPTEVQPQDNNSPTQIPKSPSLMKQTAITSVIQKATQQFFSSSITRIGDVTGDYITQNQINGALNIAGYAGAIIVNPVIGITATAVSLGVKAFDYNLRITRANREATKLRELNGGLSADYSRKRGRYS